MRARGEVHDEATRRIERELDLEHERSSRAGSLTRVDREWIVLIGLAALVGLWAACVLALVLAGRRAEAIALARFVPDCLVLFRRLVADPRVPRRHKLAFVALIGYLALPFDLVPDFIPVAGQLDDAILVILALRLALRASGPALLEEHWPGPRRGLAVLLRAASLGPRRTPAAPR